MVKLCDAGVGAVLRGSHIVEERRLERKVVDQSQHKLVFNLGRAPWWISLQCLYTIIDLQLSVEEIRVAHDLEHHRLTILVDRVKVEVFVFDKEGVLGEALLVQGVVLIKCHQKLLNVCSLAVCGNFLGYLSAKLLSLNVCSLVIVRAY